MHTCSSNASSVKSDLRWSMSSLCYNKSLDTRCWNTGVEIWGGQVELFYSNLLSGDSLGDFVKVIAL